MEIVFWKKKKSNLNVSEERKDHFDARLVSTLERHWHGVAIHEDHLSSYIKLHDIHKRNPRHLIKQAKFV